MAGYTCVFQTDEEYEEYKTNKKFNAVSIEFIAERTWYQKTKTKWRWELLHHILTWKTQT